MKRALLLVITAAFLVSSIPLFAEYNRDVTVKAMKENLAGFQKARNAAGTGDYIAAADGLIAIARSAILLSTMDPPKGSREEWAATQKELAMAAFKAIGACGAEDKTALDSAIAEIGAVMKKGHGNFR